MASHSKPSYLIGSNQGRLMQFHDAAFHRGWDILVALDRPTFLHHVSELLAQHMQSVVRLVSGSLDAIELVRGTGVVFDVFVEIDDCLL